MKTGDSHEVEQYVVTYFAGGCRAKRPYEYRTIISLYNSSGLFGALHFHDNPETLPETDELRENGHLVAHLPVSEFSAVLDILRNESPVYFIHYKYWPTMGILSTSHEPVGEGEMRAIMPVPPGP